jgi:photosystem II stability/assembly factor-like uncharacterized protein
MKRERPGAAMVIAVTMLFVLGMMAPLAVSAPEAKADSEAPDWVWSPQESGTSMPLFGVSAYDKNNVWAVGGTIPESPSSLSSSGTASTDGVTAAQTTESVILYYNGSTWVEQESPTDYTLMGVSAVAPDNVWAVGGRPWYAPGGASSVVLHWDGTEWSVAYSEDDISMMSVSALAADDVWVSGGMGIYHYDGNTWETSFPTEPLPEPPLVTGISAIDGNNVWASERHRGPGFSHILYYDGAIWHSHTWDTTNLNGVFALDTNNIWVVGDNGTVLYWDADRELPNPEVQDSGTAENLFGVTALASDNAWAVGDNGTILNWDGSAWASQASGIDADLKGVTSIAGDHAWAVSSESDILMGTWEQPATFYFAEGYTGEGFQEYLALGNPNPEAATARVTYMLPDGAKDPVEYPVPGNSRNTIDVNSELQTRWAYSGDVSLKVESDSEIIAERPMYFDYMNKWKGGHDAVGATAPAAEWYFAEGYTGLGFEMWVCVLNPGDVTAELTFRFQTQEEDDEIVVGGLSVPARSRASFKANDLLGGTSYQTSLKLESTAPVVAERPMYFSYQGTNSWNWQGGHCVMGATELSYQYYFAEGTTRSNFEEWITLQNPHDEVITVTAAYQLGVGMGEPVEESYNVQPRSRLTVFVPYVVEDVDVSVFLSSDHVFMAERPMYFDYAYVDLNAQGGHCVIGAPALAYEWFLAEGYTGDGFNQWICMQNPENEDALVEIHYYTQEEGLLEVKTVPVPANSRNTIMVNDLANAGPDYQLSTRIMVTAGPPIVVERPMYFLFNGVWDGGHDVVGFAP